MSKTSLPLLTLAALPLLSLAFAASARAQTTVVAPDSSVLVTPTPAQTTTTVTTTTTTEPSSNVAPVAGEHVAEIALTVSHGSVQAYFGTAARAETVGVGSVQLTVKLPSRATVTKLASRDDSSPGSKRITPDNPWSVRVPFNGPGRFVFNISDWDNDPVVTSCVVKVDGAVIFSGRGSEDDLNGWAQKTYGPEVRKTGSREIAFVVGER